MNIGSTYIVLCNSNHKGNIPVHFYGSDITTHYKDHTILTDVYQHKRYPIIGRNLVMYIRFQCTVKLHS